MRTFVRFMVLFASAALISVAMDAYHFKMLAQAIAAGLGWGVTSVVLDRFLPHSSGVPAAK